MDERGPLERKRRSAGRSCATDRPSYRGIATLTWRFADARWDLGLRAGPPRAAGGSAESLHAPSGRQTLDDVGLGRENQSAHGLGGRAESSCRRFRSTRGAPSRHGRAPGMGPRRLRRRQASSGQIAAPLGRRRTRAETPGGSSGAIRFDRLQLWPPALHVDRTRIATSRSSTRPPAVWKTVLVDLGMRARRSASAATRWWR